MLSKRTPKNDADVSWAHMSNDIRAPRHPFNGYKHTQGHRDNHSHQTCKKGRHLIKETRYFGHAGDGWILTDAFIKAGPSLEKSVV
jgi:hypothetical protein